MLSPMTDALIVDAVRSPIGRRHGTLASIRGDQLSAQVLNALVERNDLDPGEVEDLQWGCVTQIDEQAWNIGRNVALTAGWPVSVCGTTVDRQCGSSMQTNFNAAAAVWSGQLDVVISGGVEMMSRVPMGSNNGSMAPEALERFEIVPQGISAEYIAERWNLSREELDRYSYESHMRAAAAIDEGRFEREIIPIDLTNPHVGVVFDTDEAVRRDTTPEKMASLQPAFVEGGRITAGNSSQIVDGPAVVLQFLADTGLGERWEGGDVNPNGGGISLGHPLGATGARMTATLLSELERRDAQYGIAAMCIGFGQAIAGVVEKL